MQLNPFFGLRAARPTETPSPFPTTNKIERSPRAPKPRRETGAFRFTPHSLLNKARPRALGRSPGLSLLFCYRHRRTEEVCPARGGSVERCAPLSSSAPPGSLGCWPTKHLPAAPAARRSARSPYCSLRWGPPPIALAISYGSSSSQPRGPAPRGRGGLSGQVSPHSNGSFTFDRSREILRVLRPRFHRRGHLVHRYYQKVSCLCYCY
ncbi:hypothetical protein RchiOBHm_MTg0498641 (mitochondrion) [Rosa chinensis]|uniref:Uncharacterized protein n=1 Tax=Rosa chinensis TaxID=74649 RepID=A0A2P6P124_ROSCH|nr:hypothetical protein RchiOBHm_MTg0498641 [Rosa chinensis]